MYYFWLMTYPDNVFKLFSPIKPSTKKYLIYNEPKKGPTLISIVNYINSCVLIHCFFLVSVISNSLIL